MQLREVVEKYVHAAGGYGKSVPISSLNLSHEETERIFDVLDEDYLRARAREYVSSFTSRHPRSPSMGFISCSS